MKLISEKRFQLYYILVAIILTTVLAVFYYNQSQATPLQAHAKMIMS
jgi:hypothetical protein